MKLVEQIATVRDRIRRNGLRATLGRVVQVLRERTIPPWEKLYWVPAAEVNFIEPPDDARLVVVHREEDLTGEAWRALGESLGASAIPLYRRRLEQGCEMHLLYLGGRVVGSRFVVWGHVHSFQHVPLTERDTMGMDSRIDPAYRGRRLAPLLYSLSISDLARRGCDRVYALVAVHNEPSIRTFEAVGYRHILTQRLVRGRYRFDRGVLGDL